MENNASEFQDFSSDIKKQHCTPKISIKGLGLSCITVRKHGQPSSKTIVSKPIGFGPNRSTLAPKSAQWRGWSGPIQKKTKSR